MTGDATRLSACTSDCPEPTPTLWLLIAPTSDRKECISGALYTQINSDLRTRFTNTASSSHSGSSVFHQMTFKETASLHASPSFGILFFFLPRLVKVQLKCAGLLPASNDLSGRPLFVMAFKLGTIYWCFTVKTQGPITKSLMYVQPLPITTHKKTFSLFSLSFLSASFPPNLVPSLNQHLSGKYFYYIWKESKLDRDHNFDSIKDNLRLVLQWKEKYLV